MKTPTDKLTNDIAVEVRMALTHLEKAFLINDRKYSEQNAIYWGSVIAPKKWGDGIETEKAFNIAQDGHKIKDAIALLSKLVND